MNRFLKTLAQFSLLIACTFTLLLAGYFYFDPFRILYPYANYSELSVTTNRDYISTETFIKNYHRYHYNSFIFGSSRTLAYKPEHWKNYLDKNDSPFIFDASAETCYGIYRKIKFIDSSGVKIKNALIILCRDVSFHPGMGLPGHLFIKDPRTSGKSKFRFNLDFIKAYFAPKFILSFYTFTASGNYKPWMRGSIENRKIDVDSVTNQMVIRDQEKEITETPDAYYIKRKNVFYTRFGQKTDTLAHINSAFRKMLNEIADIFKKQNTNYSVILSPLYEEIHFHPADLKFLKETFGQNLFDFTGENYFTKDIHHYYEKSHYRPMVGDSIMHYVYNYKKQATEK